jgi:uncharacterized protein (TIGR00725 family)
VKRVNAQRRPLVSVIGNADVPDGDERIPLAEEVGRLLVQAGARVVTGGRRGVIEAAMRGARMARGYREGDTIALYPGHDPNGASEYADIVIATGLDFARNLLVANSDGVIVVGGSSGTLVELASAWHFRRPIVALDTPGWGQRVAGTRLDERVRVDESVMPPDEDVVRLAATPADAVAMVMRLIPLHTRRHKPLF